MTRSEQLTVVCQVSYDIPKDFVILGGGGEAPGIRPRTICRLFDT